MSVTINVASTKNPTHHLSLSDGTTTVGLILPDGAQGIREIPYSPSTFKTSSGGTTYSDFEPPYAFEQQDTWEGGRGLENFRKDNTRFYDSANLWTMTPNSAFLAPQWSFGTDYRLADQTMPGSVTWTSLAGETRYLARSFSATVTSADKVYLWVRRIGTPSLSLQVDLMTDSAGAPGTVLQTASVSLTIDPLSVFQPFDWSGTQALIGGTTYWIRIKSNSVDFSANHYEVATSTTVGTTLKSSDGSSWSAASVGLYFRMVGSDTRQKWHLFEYGGALFGATQPYSGAAGQLFINGDNGAADSNSGDKTLLNDATKSWTTNEWANAVALIVAGPGKGEFRKISSNTATALTVSPAWDTTHTTASDYVIIGSSKWTERATTGLTGPVTDVAVAQGVMYLAQGNAINIRRHREYNSSGTWTISDYADDGTNKADFLETFYDPVAGPVMWTASNSDGSGNVSIARANAQTWGTSLTLGTAIQIGTRDSKITGLAIYNDMLWVGKEESLWYVQNDVPNRLDLGLQAIRSPDNCKAIGAQNLFLYFNWAHSLERLYGGTTDDIGPWRDAGLPSSRQGVISALLPAIAWLFVGIDAGDTGRSSVLVYSGGWHEIFRAWETARRIDNLYWQSVLGTVNRMWVSVGGDLVWLPFPRVSLNPLRDGDMTFQHEGHIVSPWMDMGFPELDGFAKSEGVRADNLSIAERLTVQYQTNSDLDSTAWTTAANFVADPGADANIKSGGLAFKRYRRRIIFYTGDNTQSPQLLATVLKAIKRGPVKYQWIVRVRVRDAARTITGAPDHDADTLLAQLKTWAGAVTPLTMRAVSALSAMDNKLVFIEPPTLVRQFINTVLGFFGGKAEFVIREA